MTASKSSKTKMPWSIKGVTSETRKLAKEAAENGEETMGEWLSDTIRRVGAAEAAGRAVVPASKLAQSGVDPEVTEMLLKRIEEDEKRIGNLMGMLEEIVDKLSSRLERLENQLQEQRTPVSRPKPKE